ncbi:NAD-glutamate dehydrogenase [Leeia sp. TBRC 13508]|uniref:NAD-glutamate dehydrogenase n=1 Tax=Leeia speluncae TaxID=2884804 RepID=A0ABS8D9I2_9NEIS|nr:NAD-glutamate dehydrogenase [Leeia speluncae]MCB6184834.1 NAD-glutamate dehydrogenase [Leeia speluncae]
MTNPPLSEISSVIEETLVIARSKQPANQIQPIEQFISAYYEDGSADDLGALTAVDRFGAAMSHLQLAQQRVLGEANIRIYSPEFDVHGWQSTHTVIEIVNDDMPFLVDSVTMALYSRGIGLHLLVHPVLSVERDSKGKLLSAADASGKKLHRESFIHIQIDRQSDKAVLESLKQAIEQVLQDIRAAVTDESAIREKLHEAIDSLKSAPAQAGDIEEFKAFLNWIDNNRFVLLGYIDYQAKNGKATEITAVEGSGLGVLREGQHPNYANCLQGIPGDLTELKKRPEALTIVKADANSTIHRLGHLDFIGVKRYDSKGNVVGDRCFVGLYTATAYHTSPRDIPVLRQKVSHVLSACDFVENSHKEKTLLNILETYPRDELFEISHETLLSHALGIVGLQERPRVRVFLRADRFNRYVSAIVFLPRDAFNTDVRLKMNSILLNLLQGESSEFNVTLSESSLARIHYNIRLTANQIAQIDTAEIEREIAQAVRGWRDDLQHSLLEQFGEERGNALFRKYGDGFPAAYREEFLPRSAMSDIEKMDALSSDNNLAMKLYAPLGPDGSDQHFKLFRLNQSIGLSSALPMLENLGVTVLDEHPYRIEITDHEIISISDYGLEIANTDAKDALQHNPSTRAAFQELFDKVFHKVCENDGFNRLTLLAGLNWRQISVVRAYAKYLRQAGMTFSQQYVEQCLAHYPNIVRKLVSLFEFRLSPTENNETLATNTEADIRQALNEVANIDEDRILNGFLTLILATRRTNFWQTNAAGDFKPYLSFKLESSKIPFLPDPKPLFEIWVYSPRVEGVHLRGAKVARGGLRWSDRMEDFRTEVLGLVKAQMVKNAVIVPMGSKGGFVCKYLPPISDREAWLAEGIACYKTFISGLLDITDNIVAGNIVPPANVHRLDPDDPYLVVAADKGTATFSDIANSISAEYGFWLGDAFASGGSAGYDHKGMGITAKGAWESVKRHFRHIGLNTQTTDFTVIGIGDMSGDVFGNGMLLSRHIRLIAAFDHRHIFLDPNPNAESTFVERERLFKLPRSSWEDYNKELISKGGGIHPRNAKSITLTPEVKEWLGVTADQLTPNELIHLILKAPADLLYNGGIGTYVKASTQSHAEASDRASDAIRVNGNDLRVKVLAEGGNLGCTQLGRIEFALNGGRICTDAIDNSAGVDCSDHEVNIKILLGQIVANGDMTLKQRNVLLAEMTDEVGHLVLANNYLQTQVIAVGQQIAPSMLNTHARFIQHLENTGQMNRRLEFLPDEAKFNERRQAKRGLTPPEVAVLVAYSKIELYQQLLESDLPDQGDFGSLLVEYFPQPLQSRFKEEMGKHVLRREIISNQLANEIVNRMGSTFVFRLQEESAVSTADIVRAWRAASEIYGARTLWQSIEGLDNQVSAQVQADMMLQVRTLIERATRWLLRNRRPITPVNDIIAAYQANVSLLLGKISQLVPAAEYPNIAKREQQLVEAMVPADLAGAIARMDELVALFDVIELSEQNGMGLDEVAINYFALGRALQLDWLRQVITRLPRDNRWQSLARTALRDDLYRQHRALLGRALSETQEVTEQPQVSAWLQKNERAVSICQQMFGELQSYDQLDLAMLSAGMRELHNHLMV